MAAIALLLAAICFVLAVVVDERVFGLDTIRLVAAGLFFVTLALLLPVVEPWINRPKSG